MNKYKESVALNEAGVDRLSELVTDSLTQSDVERRDTTRLRLTVEEILLMWKSRLTDTATCTFSSGKRFGRSFISISMPGNKMDPAEMNDDEGEGIMYSSLLAQAGVSPTYTYVNGENRLTITPPKKKGSSTLKWLLIAIVSAIGLGALSLLLPDGVRSVVADGTDRVFSMLMGILSALAGPLIFLSICVGIINIGDVSVLSRVGKTMIIRFLIQIFLVASVGALCLSWLFNGGDATVVESTTGESSIGMQIFDMILNIIPNNIVAPFAEGNTLQIIFMAACVGVVVLVLGDKVSAVRGVVIQINSIVQILMDIVSKYISVFIFVSIFSMIVSNAVGNLLGVLKGVAICIAVTVICPLIYILIVAIRLKVSFKIIIKKILPSYLFAMSTGSPTAALSTVMDTCENKMGISRRVVNFAVPLGQVLFMPVTAVNYLLLCLTLAEFTEIPITLPWIITLVISAGMLSIATPPTQGGPLTAYAMLFAQAGIPMSAIAIAIAWNILINFFDVSANTACLEAELMLSSNKLGMLDKKILLKK